MVQQTTPNPPNVPFLKGANWPVAPEWWRFLNSLNTNVSDAANGTVTTAAGSGLQGGGTVADGISLSIADNGVSNAMFRQSAACSVVGRSANSAGNVNDIQAVTDGSVLTRGGNQLSFTPYLDNIPVGRFSAAPLVNTDLLITASDPPATPSSTGTAGTITWDATHIYVCVATDTWVNTVLGGGGGSVAWGSITGTLSAQTDLQTALNAKQPLDATLTAFAAYNTNGLITQTAADTFTGRTITGTANQITVSNGSGVAGNPTISLPAAITAPGSINAVGAVTGSNLSGTNTGDQTITLTGDVTGSGTGSFAATLATVNANVGTFGSATQTGVFTVNGKGLITAASNTTITPAAGSITGAAALTRTNDTNVTLTLGGSPTTALLAATSLTLGWTGTLAASRGGTGVGSLGNITRVDDTNVTLTLGGTPTGAVITSTSFTLGWTGTLSVARGGIGVGTVTGLLQGNGTSAVTAITNSTTVGQCLRVTGSNTYGWGALDLADTDAITGDLPFANLAQGSARSVLGVTGNSTADVASIQGTASQFLGVNSGGTALAFQTMTGDATLSGAAITLANTAVAAGSYTRTNLTVDAKGRLTSAASWTFRGALAKLSIGLTALNFTTATVIPWDAEEYDTDTIHNFSSTVTITIASPGVVTWNAHGLPNGATIVLSTTGALPTGLTAGTTYYIVSAAANTFQLAATTGGAAINTTGTQSGTHTATNYSCMKVPAGVTKIRLSACVRIDSNTSANWLLFGFNKNGATNVPGLNRQSVEISSTVATFVSVQSPVITVVAGDCFETALQSEADTSIDINIVPSNFALEIIE